MMLNTTLIILILQYCIIIISFEISHDTVTYDSGNENDTCVRYDGRQRTEQYLKNAYINYIVQDKIDNNVNIYTDSSRIIL